jgi:hypothetical protein
VKTPSCMALLLCLSPLALATGAAPLEGEIAISLGEVVHFELADGVIGRRVPAALVNAPSAAQPVVRVSLASDANGNRTLRIRNSYARFIQLDFRICESTTDADCKTTVEGFAIGGGTELSQLLQDHAARVVFYNFSHLREEERFSAGPPR